MSTINGIRAGGVPKGTKCAKNSVRLFDKLNIMNPIHKGRAKAKVIERCLVAVKVNERSPKELLIIIRVNKAVNRRMFLFWDLRRIENSVVIAFKIIENSVLKGDESTQKEGRNTK